MKKGDRVRFVLEGAAVRHGPLKLQGEVLTGRPDSHGLVRIRSNDGDIYRIAPSSVELESEIRKPAATRRGRPRIAETRGERFGGMRLTADELALIERAAELTSRKPGDLVRLGALKLARELVAAHEAADPATRRHTLAAEPPRFRDLLNLPAFVELAPLRAAELASRPETAEPGVGGGLGRAELTKAALERARVAAARGTYEDLCDAFDDLYRAQHGEDPPK